MKQWPRRANIRPISASLCLLLLATGLLLSAHSVTYGSTAAWTRQRPSSLAWLHAIFFLDQHRGWAAGSRGTLLMTTDGGATWQSKSQPTVDVIRDVYFLDDLNGFLVCERNIYDLKTNDEPRAYLMKTEDGGAKWKRLNLRGATVDARLMRAVFHSSGYGWAFGEGGVLFTTRDAGENWMRLQAPTRYLLLGGAFVNQNSGWLVGAGSTLLQTSDGGQTWNHSRAPARTKVRFNSASFVNERLGWTVGSNGTILRTNNGGHTWIAQDSGVTTDLLDVKFVDASEGWAVGDEGTLLHTTNGGVRWIEERSGTPHTLERIFFTDRNHGWAVGFGGTIIAYGPANAPRLSR
ncbi:MAG TPA: YCF48-related protein [Pyrinomonadaceae bacterium]|nr:YCF48-related protein [Pyrinomonadaceae bacterium]